MGDSRVFYPGNDLESRVITTKKLSKRCVLASTTKVLSHKTLECITSMKQGILGSGAAGDIVLFLLKTAALDIVRRLSRAKCPLAWHGLQVLQVLSYPPFKWIQRWAPFKGLVNFMQSLSRPLLALTIATVFSDKSACTKEALDSSNDSQGYSESQLGPSAQLSTPDKRSCDEVLESQASEKWLLQLHKELEKQGITLPERLNVGELRRFYAAANGEFPRLLSSVKKTIRWRQTYNILSPQELERWSHLVFWHECDVKLRPCLIVRVGLACSNFIANNRPLFIKAIVSQIEYGVMHLVDAENPQITVLMDCEGLSPFGFPMQMMRSCAILLQDHYPNRLGCLIVIRLRPLARVITQTLFQVLRPATQQKVRIVGENYQKVLSEYLQTFPSFLGGKCPCSKCSDPVDIQGKEEEMIQMKPTAESEEMIQMKSTAEHKEMIQMKPTAENKEMIQMKPTAENKEMIQIKPTADVSNVTSQDMCYHSENNMNGGNRDQVVRTAIIGVLLLWLFIVFLLGMHYPEYLPFLYWQGGS